MRIGIDPLFRVLPRNIDDRVGGQGFNGDGSLRFIGQKRHLSDKINGFVGLDHIDLAVFKFVDHPILTLGHYPKVSKFAVLLVDQSARGMYFYTGKPPKFSRHGFGIVC